MSRIVKPCPICNWEMNRKGKKLVCKCGYSEPLPVDILLRERNAQPLPGFEEKGG